MSQHPEVRAGMALLAVDGQAVPSYDRCMQLLAAAGRPVRLHFSVEIHSEVRREAADTDDPDDPDDPAIVANAELENTQNPAEVVTSVAAAKEPKGHPVANWLRCSKADNYTGCFADRSKLPSTEFGPGVPLDQLASVDMLARWHTHDEYLMCVGQPRTLFDGL
jgi:hypothetical protein